MTDQPAPRPRPSISERAARREALQRSERDRYANLVRALQAGREIPFRPGRGERLEWHPIARVLVVLAIIAVVAYAVGSVVNNVWREMRVDTWGGPDATVTSGQRLAGCAAANSQQHAYLPTWVRYGDRVFVLTPRQRPLLGQGRPNQTDQIETGYSLERLRILLPEQLRADEPPSYILIVQAGSSAAAIFQHEPACT
jgi:Na+-transporting methylmalonyl-CoA/oxaloacetate decarboxylase gamma subunit